jgi:hypothetical protein
MQSHTAGCWRVAALLIVSSTAWRGHTLRRHPREPRLGIGGRLGDCRLCARAIDARRLRAALVRSSNVLSIYRVSRYM